jgi:hypothetical protein
MMKFNKNNLDLTTTKNNVDDKIKYIVIESEIPRYKRHQVSLISLAV